MTFIAFAALGDPRTTRQGRGLAVAGAVIAVVVVRIGGFAASSAAARSPGAVAAIYAVPLLAILVSALVIFHGPALRERTTRLTRALAAPFGRRPRLGLR